MITFTKNNTIFLLFTLLFSQFAAQAQGFEWANRIGDVNNDQSYAIALDPQGNIYTTGIFSGTVDLDPGPGTLPFTSKGQDDIFLQKLDSAGNLVWAKQFGGKQLESANNLTIDPNGNIYLIGSFQDTIDFDLGPGVANLATPLKDIFVLKLNAAGDFVWAVQTLTLDITIQMGTAIAVDAAGNVYTTGDFRKTVDFDPGPGEYALTATGTNGAGDVFIQKLDADGKFVWTKQIGGEGYDSGTAITTDADGNVYTTGYYRDDMDFDPGPGVDSKYMSGKADIFIVKLDAGGNYVWGKKIGGPDWETINSFLIGNDGNIIATGDFVGTADFDPGTGVHNLTSVGDYDAFVQKLDPDGNLIWVKQMGAFGSSSGSSVYVDSSGGIYSTGSFTSATIDFDPGPGVANLTPSGYKTDIYIQKLDKDGNFEWVRQMGGEDWDYSTSIKADQKGNVYVGGYFYGTADFNPDFSNASLTSAGNRDAFLAKMNLRWNFHGTVFNDLNSNQIQDAGEPGMPNILLSVKDRGLFTTTDSAGRYHLYADIIADTLRTFLLRPYWLVKPEFTIPDSMQTTMDFAIEIPSGIKDVAITAIETRPFQPGFVSKMLIQVVNKGSAPVDSVVVVFEVVTNPNPLEFKDADPAPDLIIGDSLIWVVGPLDVGQTAVIHANFKTLATTSIGSSVNYRAKANLQDDAFPPDNSFGGRSTVVGSYDPNDKQVSPKNLSPEELDSTDLRYVIRFQNTGNYPASFVTIVDTLPSGLDATTLNVFAASHPYSWRLYGERILEVQFDPIVLPDSVSNEPASHGFVAFTVKSKQPLAEGDSVSNRAGIYFDYNAPVITNYAVMQVKTITSTSHVHSSGFVEISL
ncbi:MAG TPA: SBBP repeat-containing protein, partial [Saprospiraceae bacterium]|nr:SBBP repeat-containing protein [Saprospiraceae bacterium]